MRRRAVRSTEFVRVNQGQERPPTTGDPTVVILANRAPLSHKRLPTGDVIVTRSASGLVTALGVRREFDLSSDLRVGVGIDRLDYTKGIPQKFLAIERLLENCPELRGKFVFVQVAEPSRGCLPEYQAIRRQVLDMRDRVNQGFGSGDAVPIRLLDAHHDAGAVYRLYRAADLCYVGSLRDGMNLVAKEFVRARDDERGVLVLSEFTGAARQLQAALLFNPDDVDGAADALHRALCMSHLEQAARMRTLRSVVRRFSAQWWAEQLLQDAHRESNRTGPAAAECVSSAAQVPA
jgi:trehalose 6-phosphate synthase